MLRVGVESRGSQGRARATEAAAARSIWGSYMFFLAKSAFWLSIVALAMPGAEVELSSAAASLRAVSSDKLAGLGAACLAAPACRVAVMEVAAENFAVGAASRATPAKATARAPTGGAKVAAAKSSRPALPRQS